jgi:DNA-binding LytR/AlgR family response regulator
MKHNSIHIYSEEIAPTPTSSREFIVCKRGHSLMPVKLTDLMLFKSVIKTTFTIDGNNNKYLVDKTLNELEEILITKHFFRVNRQIILNISAIKEFRSLEFGKIAIALKSSNWIGQEFVFVSQVTAPAFRHWINNL